MSDNIIKITKKPVIFKKPTKVENKSENQLSLSLASKNINKKTTKSRINELEEEVNLLTSYTTDTVYRLDYRNMRYDYVSPAITTLLGFTPQEMKRINFRSLIVETKIVTDGLRNVGSFDELEEERKNGDVGKWQADYLMRNKNGKEIWVSDVSHPWFDDNGKVIGSVGSLREITDRVKAEEKILKDIEISAAIDEVTGISDKAGFFKNLDREIKRAKRSSEEFSVVLFDIAEIASLQKENKEKADKLSKLFAGILYETLRETDFIANFSEGVFGAILPDTDLRGAYWVSERIRLETEKTNFNLEDDGIFSTAKKLNICAGISNFLPSDEVNAADLFKLADTRLYIAKNTGKNQVSIDEVLHIH